MPDLLPIQSPEKIQTSSYPAHRKRISGAGEMADLVRSHDWARTSLGPIDTWPDALIFSVNIMLSCQFPAVVFWGAEMIQFYNDGYRPLMAEKHPRALGQPARECWKEAWDIIGPQFEATYQNGKTTYREEVLVPVIRNGRLRDIYWTYSYSPIFDSQGQIDGILIVCHDVTDEIFARQKLGESEERLRIALAAADGVGIWDWDVEKDLVFADAGFAQLYGVSSHAATHGISLAQFTRNIHPDDIDRVRAAIDQALKIDCEFSEEYRLLQPDGSIRWVLAVGRCSFGPGGGPIRFPGVTIDITARKATEEALRESQARLDSIYSASLEYIGLLTPEGIILDSNRASLEFANSSYQDLIGTHFADGPWFAYTTGAPDIARESIARAATGERILREVSLTRPSGEILTFDFSLAPVKNANGEVIFLVPEGRDITEVKRTEAALLQSEKLAAVGRLASSIAHEINNPLESVTNLIFLARQNAVSPETQRYLEIADQELRRVAVIANQTLRFHKQSSKPRPISAVDLFSSVLGIYEGKLKNSGVLVETRYSAIQPVVCFEGDVRQILNNLVSNALDAMNTGGRLLLRSREATEWSTGRKGLVLTIADTGCGMSPEVSSQIFEPFFTTKGIGGTGLGLWVSKEVVDRHKGTLCLRSSAREGQSGTVFTLFLPFQPEK
jgi:PAS domain S-box-containing protein